jgi:CheY-like chemotaxis protein
MKTSECSECGRAANAHVWGFALLARDGWNIAPTTNPPGAAERAWLCQGCAARAELARQAIARRNGSTHPRSVHGLRVLIVDDHVLLLRCMARLLRGCDTVLTTSPREALAILLGGGEFDVILCDVMMPEVTGPELYERCFAHSPALGKRFLFASSDPITARPAIDEAAERVGASHAPPLLRKPVSEATLTAAVSGVVAQAAHASGTYVLLPDRADKSPRADTGASPEKPMRRSSHGFR